MTTRSSASLTILLAITAAACAPVPLDPEPEGRTSAAPVFQAAIVGTLVPAPDPVVVPAPVPTPSPLPSSGFVFDRTALTTYPSGRLPSTRLDGKAFTVDRLRTGLIRTAESFAAVEQRTNRYELESASWHLETDMVKGAVLVLSKLPAGSAQYVAPATLERASLARLAAWGVPSEELGEVRQRQALLQSNERGLLSPVTPYRHKTFVMRQIGGIRVEGHRAVVTHALDGRFHRALVKWPALALTGHLLRTTLPLGEIEQRAREALIKEGETAGAVKLTWKYVPVAQPSGEVTLVLRASAFIESGNEPREIDVDVSAVP